MIRWLFSGRIVALKAHMMQVLGRAGYEVTETNLKDVLGNPLLFHWAADELVTEGRVRRWRSCKDRVYIRT